MQDSSKTLTEARERAPIGHEATAGPAMAMAAGAPRLLNDGGSIDPPDRCRMKSSWSPEEENRDSEATFAAEATSHDGSGPQALEANDETKDRPPGDDGAGANWIIEALIEEWNKPWELDGESECSDSGSFECGGGHGSGARAGKHICYGNGPSFPLSAGKP